VSSLKAIVENLHDAQQCLLRAADTVPAQQWRAAPGEGQWSAGEVVCHLIVIERAILKSSDRLLQKPPRALPFYKRFHIPMAIVEARLMRLKTPIPIEAEMVRGKEEMLAELREVRGRTLAFIEETSGKDLSKYNMPHPFLGTLNAYEWFQLIASHEIRHTKQMKEIAARLPKAVAYLQK
jgi:DinB superfamily